MHYEHRLYIHINTKLAIVYCLLSNNQPATIMEKINEVRTYTNPLVQEYIKSLTEKEYKSYEIAQDHLGTLFDMERTNGFLAWMKKRES